ncbi:glycosyltransferase family 2 protein [Patescibacteria group bacterium]|nr:MAG: glycosyltransferase family 2 protein [Patescibacteria group bacterium]
MEKSFPLVYAVVVNWNSRDTISACLTSLFRSDYPNLQIVVVDNYSTDGSLEFIRQNFDRTHIIQNDRNVGFGMGANVAIRFALEKMADYIFLINPDATIQPSALSQLVTTLQFNPQAGIVSPLITTGSKSSIWFAGGIIDWKKMRAEHQFEQPTIDKPLETEFVSGCAMLVSKDVFREIGLFSQDYFLYYEDVGFCRRAKLKGFHILLDPRARVWHAETSEQRSAEKTYWLVFSALIFFAKHSPFRWRLWHFIYLPLRRLKNWRDLKNNPTHSLALATQRAYSDFTQWKRHR